MNFSFNRGDMFCVPYGLFYVCGGRDLYKVNQFIAFSAFDKADYSIPAPPGGDRLINHHHSLASQQVPRLPTGCSD